LGDFRSSLLDSPAIGSGRQITFCHAKGQPRAAEPDAPASGPPIGVTFSGGGFRATLAALGVARYLADAGLLANVRYASSVSGGSVTNGLLATAWPALRRQGYGTGAVEAEVIEPAVRRISGRSLKWSLLRNAWRVIPPGTTRTDLLAGQFDDWFFDERRLEQLDPEVRWVVNAANIVTGVRFGFERDVVGDYVSGLTATAGTGLRLAQAAAASAAVPGAFAAWEVPDEVRFPCAEVGQPVLLDGGVYDNTGLEVLDGDAFRPVFTVSINAGGLLRPGGYGKIPVVRDLLRANSLLYRQSTGLRTRMMVDAFIRAKDVPAADPLPAGARRGVLVGLGTDQPKRDHTPELEAWVARHPEARTWDGEDLAFVPTVFDRLDEVLCRRLVYRGWWLTGAAMAQYFPAMAPDAGAVEPPPLPPERR
jgi:NTE family protein